MSQNSANGTVSLFLEAGVIGQLHGLHGIFVKQSFCKLLADTHSLEQKGFDTLWTSLGKDPGSTWQSWIFFLGAAERKSTILAVLDSSRCKLLASAETALFSSSSATLESRCSYQRIEQNKERSLDSYSIGVASSQHGHQASAPATAQLCWHKSVQSPLEHIQMQLFQLFCKLLD